MRIVLRFLLGFMPVIKIGFASDSKTGQSKLGIEESLLIEKALENSTVEKIDTSLEKNIQFSDRNKNCYTEISNQILQFLSTIGHPYQKEDLNSIEVYSKHAQLDVFGIPTMYFEVVLNVNHLVNKDLDGKKLVKKYTTLSKSLSLEHLLSRRFIKIKNVQNAKVTVLFKNFDLERKSKIEILLEIKANESKFPTKLNDTNATSSIIKILNIIPNEYVFQRSQLKLEPFKFGKFSSSSTNLGLFLAFTSCSLCGLSFVLKKRSLMKLKKNKNYYQDKGWWLAHTFMVVGDILHFIAFFFAPAVLVCTLQMMMVIVVASASSLILGEKVNTYWKLAFALSLGGSLVLIVHTPRESHIYSINAFLYMVTAPAFLTYLFCLLLITIIMMSCCIPKWSHINSLTYTIQSAIFGSVIVIGLKGILVAFTDKLFHWLPWTCLLIVGICLLLQLDYLNRALSYYNTLVVTTQYYVLYSALVIISSSILYEVWQISSDETIMVIFFGFTTTVMGVLIFAIFQEDDAVFDFSKLFAGPDIYHQSPTIISK